MDGSKALTNGAAMTWDLETIRKNAWATTFGRGWRAWLKLVTVCFAFAFIGATNATQANFVDILDRLLGSSDVLQPHNAPIIESHLTGLPSVHELIENHPDLVDVIINSVTERASWIVSILALNPRYLADNPEEAATMAFVAAIIGFFIRFFVLNVIAIGQYRYVMETRFSRNVPWQRTLAPFHLKTLPNVLWVMVCYHISLLLWTLTIVGAYKVYQYGQVPYLLAENPQITWREARRLSTRMTDGYKRKILAAQLSYLPVLLLRLVPVVGMLVAVPLFEELNAEIYFTLRANPALDDGLTARVFVEPTFGLPAYATLPADEQQAIDVQTPTYVLEGLDVSKPQDVKGMLPYNVIDLVYMFFIFCFIGWVWEVGLHFFQCREFANRGTLYGPWIPIYGFGGAGMVIALDRYREQPAKLFALAVVLAAVLEYATSFVLDFMFNASYWSYNDMMFNVNGRICLAGLLAFGLGGIVGVYLAAPAISRAVNKMPVRTRHLGATVLLAAFCSDFVYCLFNGFNSGAGVGEEL